MRRHEWGGVIAVITGLVIVAAVLCNTARAEDAPDPLRPFWTGPVYGVFTDAGPDSIEGPRTKIHVPIGVALTKPFGVKGYQLTPEAQFQWTTKAYIGEDSDPLRDAAYNWFPYVRVVREQPGHFEWLKVGPEHLSNGDVDVNSRSMNALSVDTSWLFQAKGIDVHIYAKGWFVYDYGENTAGIKDAIALVDDFGGQLIVRASLSMADLAVELGPEWQKYEAFIPLQEFYNFGFYGEIHNGKMEGLLDYGTDVTTIAGGVAFRPK